MMESHDREQSPAAERAVETVLARVAAGRAVRGAFDIARETLLTRYGSIDPAAVKERGGDPVEVAAAQRLAARVDAEVAAIPDAEVDERLRATIAAAGDELYREQQRAVAFNAVGRSLAAAAGPFVPLSVRRAIADGVLDALNTLAAADGRAPAVVDQAADDCPDPWHSSPTEPTEPCPACGDQPPAPPPIPGQIVVTPALPADGWADVDQAAALVGQVTRLGTRFADADGPGQALVLVTLPDGRQVIGAAALHLFVPAARYIGRGGFPPPSSFDWSRYERTCDPDRQLDGTGDLCLFLGGSWGETSGARSFIGDVLALADRATGQPERLNALALAFPRELTAWRVWRTWPGPTPTAAELYAELTREQPR